MKKKIIAVLLSVLLLFSLIPSSVLGAGASFSGNSTLRAGDTLTLTFSISGYSKVYGIEGTIKYSSDTLTFQSASGLMPSGWSVEYNNKGDGSIKILAYDNNNSNPVSGGNVIRLKFKVSSSAATGASVNVSSSGVVLSTGDPSAPTSTSVSGASYSKKIAAPLSTNNYLSSLSVTGYDLSPSFSKTQLGYRLSVPYTLKSLPIKATPEDSSAKVSVSGNALTPGKTTTVRVKVTSASGAKRTYSIVTTVAKDPNAKQSSSNELSALTVSPGILSPVFDPNATSYVVYVPNEVTKINVSAKAKDQKATVKVEYPEELVAGDDNLIRVISTAENGGEKVYTVTVKRALPWGATTAQSVDSTEILAQISSATEETPTIRWDLSSTSQTQIDRSVFESLRDNINAELLIDFGAFKVGASASDDMEPTADFYNYALYNDEGIIESINGYLQGAAYDTLLFSMDEKLANYQRIYTLTPYLEGDKINVYRFDSIESRFYLIAKDLEVSHGGMLSFLTNRLGSFVFTPALLEGAVNEDVTISKNTKDERPLTLDSIKEVFSSLDKNAAVIIGAFSFVALLAGVLVGYLAFGLGNKRLRRRIRALEHASSLNVHGVGEVSLQGMEGSVEFTGDPSETSPALSKREARKLAKQQAKEERLAAKAAKKAERLAAKEAKRQAKLAQDDDDLFDDDDPADFYDDPSGPIDNDLE